MFKLENLDAWIIYVGIPLLCLLLFSIAAVRGYFLGRRRNEWQTDKHKELYLLIKMKTMSLKQKEDYITEYRTETFRFFGGPCPHPKYLINDGGECVGCLTKGHHYSALGLPKDVIPTFFVILLLVLIWAIFWGPWSDEFWNPPSRYDGCDIGDICDENYPSM